jgi:hypothetical protein
VIDVRAMTQGRGAAGVGERVPPSALTRGVSGGGEGVLPPRLDGEAQREVGAAAAAGGAGVVSSAADGAGKGHPTSSREDCANGGHGRSRAGWVGRYGVEDGDGISRFLNGLDRPDVRGEIAGRRVVVVGSVP